MEASQVSSALQLLNNTLVCFDESSARSARGVLHFAGCKLARKQISKTSLIDVFMEINISHEECWDLAT